MKLLSKISPGKKVENADAKKPLTHKAWEHANLAQLACDNAQGWDACKDVVAEGATFNCQCDTFKDMKTIKEYVDWCEGFAKMCPGPTFDVRFKMYDPDQDMAIFLCTYHATHTGEGGPVPATGKTTDSDYVYTMKFNDQDKIVSMEKVWNDVWACKELGWM